MSDAYARLRNVTTATITTMHERYETWVVSEVERGVPLPGLYPANDEAKARYETWKKQG